MVAKYKFKYTEAHLADRVDELRDRLPSVHTVLVTGDGGSYDDAADFWLDDHDRLARYRFPQAPGQVWEVTLATGG